MSPLKNHHHFWNLFHSIILLSFLVLSSTVRTINGFQGRSISGVIVSRHHRPSSSLDFITRRRQELPTSSTTITTKYTSSSSILKIPALSLLPQTNNAMTTIKTTPTTRQRSGNNNDKNNGGRGISSLFQKSALFSTSSAASTEVNNNKRLGFFARLRWLVLFPIVSTPNRCCCFCLRTYSFIIMKCTQIIVILYSLYFSLQKID